MDLLAQIEASIPEMSKGHKQLARYILENYDKASYMTALKLGKATGISESTVVRFAYSLGFDGYPKFQKALKQLVQNKLTPVQRLKISQDEIGDANVYETILKADMANIKSTLEHIDQQVFEAIIHTLLSSRRIYILGMRSAATLSGFLSHYLNYLLPDKVAVMPNFSDMFEYLIRIQPQDCLIGMSFPRYSRNAVAAMRFAREQGAKTIAITDNPISPLSEYADYALYAKSNATALADSLVAPLSLINAIVAAVSLQREEEAKKYFAKLEQVWGERNIYSEMETNG